MRSAQSALGILVMTMTSLVGITIAQTLGVFTSAFFSLSLGAVLLGASGYSIFRLKKLFAIKQRRILALQNKQEKMLFSANKFIVDRVTELRRPLQGLVGIHDLYASGTSAQESKDYFDIADFCSRFLLRQLERIQLFAELESRSLRFDCEPFSLKTCISDAISLASEQANARDVSIIEEWSPYIQDAVVGNEPSLRKILIELLDNAIRYGAHGRIYLRITPDTENNSLIRFTISDSGPGLSEKQKSQLLSPDSGKKRKSILENSRSGMGLFLTQKMISAMNGSIYVDSKTGTGTTVSFALSQDFLKTQNFVNESTAPQQEVPRILVVDDEPISCQIICSILKKIGHTADVATNGRDAIMKCQHGNYNLIIMDLNMPMLDGFEATRIIINELKLNQTPKIIIASSNCTQADRDKCAQLGASDFLAKPVRVDEVRQSLEKLGFVNKTATEETKVLTKPANQMQSSLNSTNTQTEILKPKEPGYYIDFNKLFNTMDENITLCTDVLLQVSQDLDKELEFIARAMNKNDRKELMSILHKVRGELSMVLCSRGIEAVEKMEHAARIEGVEHLQKSFEELSETFEGISAEIEGMKSTKSLVI